MPLVRKPPSKAAGTPGEPRADARALESANADDRWAAARAGADAPGSVAALSAALRKETDARVREAIFTALVRIGTRESTQELVSLLRSGDAALRTGALDALQILTRESHDFLPQLLRDSDADVRILSCELARAISAAEATRLLCELLASELEPNVCAAAVEVLAEVGDASALAVLAECAQRFAASSFLVFAISVATDRITAQPVRTRG